jgi:hypothetical protein
MIQPGAWSKDSIKYYAPAKILVVCHTPGVHSQVRAFLAKLKEAAALQKQTTSIAVSPLGKAHAVIPANFNDFGSLAKTASPAKALQLSPASQQPMHLFHIIVEGLETEGDKVTLKNFTFRYEGEGIIDSKIAALIKSYNEQAGKQGEESSKSALNTSQIVQSLLEILKMAGFSIKSADSGDNKETDEAGSSSSSSSSKPAENVDFSWILQTRDFNIPIHIDEARRARIGKLRLFVSADGGKSWKHHKDYGVDEDTAKFSAPRDGLYCFAVQVVSRDGTKEPQDDKLVAGMKVYVQSEPIK